MHIFAQQTGYEGSGSDWADEFAQLCDDHDFDQHTGISFEEFVAFIDDETDAGQYCSIETLEDICEGYEQSATKKGKSKACLG